MKFFPQGATALDFAYAIHTEVGNKMVGAKVNGRMVPFRYELHSGDTVEILTKEDQRPSRDWLQIARTGRALSKIRREIREDERAKGREIGRTLLETELKKHKTNINKLIKDGTLKSAAREHGFRQVEQLYLALAQGHLTIARVMPAILPPEALEAEEEEPSAITNFFQKIRSKSESPVLINGVEDVMVSYAQCCQPVPGEAVTGFVTRGRGITVHLSICSQLLAMDPDRRIPVQWHKTGKALGKHTGEIRIICNDKPGMLAEIGAVCKTVGINVTRMEAAQIEDNKAVLSLEVSITDVKELERFMRNMERIKGVLTVDRVRAQGMP